MHVDNVDSPLYPDNQDSASEIVVANSLVHSGTVVLLIHYNINIYYSTSWVAHPQT
jgi:hypothetical protein